jgi:cysteine desulfurase/selenocysteine lyase
MIARVTLEDATWNDVPHRFEAGTPNVAGAIGLAAALEYLAGIGLDAIQAHETALTRYALERLDALAWITRYGPAEPERRPGIVTFNDPAIHPHDLATLLDRDGIAVRAGHHCTQPLMQHLGIVASTRASFHLTTTTDEIEALAEGLDRARRTLGHG